MGSSRSEMQCPEFESPMDHQKERTPDRVCVLSLSKKEGTSKGLLPPFGEKSGKEEGKEERGVVPGAV